MMKAKTMKAKTIKTPVLEDPVITDTYIASTVMGADYKYILCPINDSDDIFNHITIITPDETINAFISKLPKYFKLRSLPISIEYENKSKIIDFIKSLYETDTNINMVWQ